MEIKETQQLDPPQDLTQAIQATLIAQNINQETLPETQVAQESLNQERDAGQLAPKRSAGQNTAIRRNTMFARRAIRNVNDFIRVRIVFRNGTEFFLNLDINNNIEYVARQIEAEITIKSIAKKEEGVIDFAPVDLTKAVDVYQLYDIGGLAIPFSQTVKEVLQFDDCIYPITSIEEADGINDINIEMAQSSIYTSAAASLPSNTGVTLPTPQFHQNQQVDYADSETQRDQHNVDDRLEQVLYNTAALQFFNEFCLQEYAIENVLFWIEAEVFRSIHDDAVKALFGQHLVDAYVKLDSPLRLNINADVRDTVLAHYKDKDSTMFADLQNFIFILIKQAAFIKFEGSALFQNLMNFKLQDRYSYVQGKVDWDYDTLLRNNQSMLDVVHSPLNTLTSPSIQRDQYLLATIANYIPNSRKPAAKYLYFDQGARLTKKRQIEKQKRLNKFFGGAPSFEHMRQQKAVSGSGDSVSIATTRDEDDCVTTPRKKQEKLHGFFGETVVEVTGKIGNAMTESLEYLYLNNPKSTTDEDQDAIIFGNLNVLTGDQKLQIQRRAKKLLDLLGTGLDVNLIVSNTTPLAFEPSSGTSIAGSSKHSSITSLQQQTEEEMRMEKIKKADKLGHFFGKKVPGTTEMQKIQEEESSKLEYDSITNINSLSPEKKDILQKRAKKLLGILGNDVNLNLRPSMLGSVPLLNEIDKEGATASLLSGSNVSFTRDDSYIRGEKLEMVRKVGKLATFFGNDMNTQQMLHFVGPVEAIPVEPAGPETNYGMGNVNDQNKEEELEVLAGFSVLTRKEKIKFKKRVKKINAILGEYSGIPSNGGIKSPLKDTSSVDISESVSRDSGIAPSFHAEREAVKKARNLADFFGGAISASEMGNQKFVQKPNPNVELGAAIINSTVNPEELKNEYFQNMTIEEKAILHRKTETLLGMLHSYETQEAATKSVGAVEEEEDEEDEEDGFGITKPFVRTKVEKLSHMMGEKVTDNLLEIVSINGKQSNSSNTNSTEKTSSNPNIKDNSSRRRLNLSTK